MPTPVLYNKWIEATLDGNAVDLDSTSIKIALVTASYTPDQAHDFFDDARYAIWYFDTATPGTSPLIMYMDLGANVGNVAVPLVLTVTAASGVLQAASS